MDEEVEFVGVSARSDSPFLQNKKKKREKTFQDDSLQSFNFNFNPLTGTHSV